ncbi:MAG TPA: XdhC family protein [Candidatus Nanopelagicales bacterium]
MPELEVWRALAGALAADAGPVALLAVVASGGSSPGRPAAVMAVSAVGPLAGTIGGGAAEAGLVERVVTELAGGGQASGPAQLVRLEHRAGAPGTSGLVCGGWQQVLVCPLGATDLRGVRRVAEVLAAGLAVAWTAGPDGWRVTDEGCAPMTGEPATVTLTPGPWRVRVRSGPSHVVHVVGAGHVGRALVPLLVGLDFRVVAVDERAEVLPVPGAHASVHLPAAGLGGLVPPGPASFVAIATHDIGSDRAALASVTPLELGYLGLLGSRAKLASLVGGRTMPPWFHAPMGLPIGSATPAEIAVSVAAELVAVRAQQVGRLRHRTQDGAPLATPAAPPGGRSPSS